MTAVDARKRLDELVELPELVTATLRLEPRVRVIARGLLRAQSVLYLGRGVHYPIALEGALKLKELSYSHAEGYAAGEMKHGPIALLTEGFPVVALVPRDQSYDRMLCQHRGGSRAGRSGHRRVSRGRRRGGSPRGSRAIRSGRRGIFDPDAQHSIPLQFLAYHLAVLRGHDVDQPRNLAKSVTVE